MYLVELNCVPRLAKSKFRIYYLASFNYGWGQAGKACQRVCAMALEDRMAEKNGESFAGLWDQAGSSMCQGQGLAGSQHSVIALTQQQHPPWGLGPRPQG